MTEKYELNEKDIDSTLNFLRIFDPERANPETAIAFLEYMYLGVHVMSHTSPKELEDLYLEFIKSNKEDKKS